MDPLLSVEDLHVEYRTPRGVLAAVKGVTLNVERREVVGLVGETGSGKSTIARAVVNRVRPPGQIPQGRIMFNGQDLLGLSPKEMRQVRGRKIALIIQNPAAALNPLLTVNTQFMNVHHAHGEGTKESAKAKILDLLHQVQLRDPQRVLDTYAHQLSGGMAQRVMIAMALLHSPELLIADEATTGLDATIQAHILDLLAELVNQYQMSALVITHEDGHCPTLLPAGDRAVRGRDRGGRAGQRCFRPTPASLHAETAVLQPGESSVRNARGPTYTSL